MNMNTTPDTYVTIKTEIKVGDKPAVDDKGEVKKNKDGEVIKVAIKEPISFLVPKIDFFADVINSEFSPAVWKTETTPATDAHYENAKAQWLFDAIISKCRSVLTSRISVKDGKLEFVAPYKPWTGFDEMIKVLGQRGRVGKASMVKAFVADFTAYLLTLGKSEKYTTQRVLLASDDNQLAACSEAVREKFAANLGEFFQTLTEDQKEKHQDRFGDLMAICSGRTEIESLSED